ncbi:MAG: DUF11 domain-containing protein, partial [bacterium]|nr:DUF11 domain-containing protein [bacterium]
YKLIAQANLEATVTNLATVSSATPDSNAGNNTAQAQTVLTRSADLELGKSAPVEVHAGEELVYTVTVTNHGPADATGVELVDTLPDGVVFQSAADGCVHDGSPRGGAVTCTVGNVASGTAIGRTITVLVSSAVVGLITNSATATTGDQPDADPANNTASADTTVRVSADLRVTKTDNRTTVVPGRRIRYRITVTNHGPSAVTGATVTDLMPPQLVDVSYTSTTSGAVSGNTASGTGDIADTVDLAVGATLTYTVWALVAPSASGPVINTATAVVPAGAEDPDGGNNSVTDHNSLSPEGDLAITKDDGLDELVPGTLATYTITVRNTVELVGTLYFSKNSDPSGLYVLDPATGGATHVGTSGVTAATVGLAPSLDPGLLYGSKPTGLLSIRTDGGGAGELGGVEAEGLALDPATGTLYYAADSAFGTLHPGTGDALAALAAPSGDLEALACGHGGVYGLMRLDQNLYFYDPGLDAWSPVGGTGIAWTNAGLAYDPAHDVLYAKHGPDKHLYRIDPATAATTVVGDTGILAGGGLAFVAPEGISDAAGTVVTDVFPPALPAATWTCAPSPGSACNAGSGSALNDTATVAALGSVTYTVTGLIDPRARGQLTNTATVTPAAGFTDYDGTNHRATDTAELKPLVDLVVTKVDSVDPVVAGSGAGNLVHTITLTNQGPSHAVGVVASELLTIPAHVAIDAITPSGTTAWSDPTWTVGELPVGASETLTVVLTVAAQAAEGAVIRDTATVTAVVEPRINTGDDAASEQTLVTRRVDLALSKSESGDPVVAGSGAGNLTYVVTVANQGPSDVSGVTVSEVLTLPAGVSLDEITPGAGSYSEPTWSVGDLPAGARATLTVVLTAGPATAHGAVVSDTATVTGANETLIMTGDDTVTEDTTVVDRTPPTVAGIVAGALGSPVEDCGQLHLHFSALRATFSETVQDPPGDDGSDDVTNPANYLLVAAGPDQDFSTDSCGPARGDDVVVAVDVVTYEAATRTATLSLNAGAPLRGALYRLFLCGTATIRDVAGNPLDGNGDEVAGDDFVRTFRVEPSNLLINGYFDCSLDEWLATEPAQILHSPEDLDGSSLSGSAELDFSTGSDALSLGQCAPVAAEAEYLLSSRVRVAVTAGSAAGYFASCEFHPDLLCAAEPLASSTRFIDLGDTGAQWLDVSTTLGTPAGTRSASCAVGSVLHEPGDVVTVFVDNVILIRETGIFADGFESGDTSAWSSTAGRTPRN